MKFIKEHFLLIVLLIWMGYVIMDSQLVDRMFNANGDIVPGLQSHTSTTTKHFWEFISLLVNIYVGAGYVGAMWIFGYKRIKALKYLTYILIAGFMEPFLKMLYAYPRPFMVFPDVQALQCGEDFGRPSGHALAGMVMYGSLFQMFINPWVKKVGIKKKLTMVEMKNDPSSMQINSSNDQENKVPKKDSIEENNFNDAPYMSLPKQDNNEKKSENNGSAPPTTIINSETRVLVIEGPINDTKQTMPIRNKIFFGFAILLRVTIVFLIGYSRVVLGLHSFDQVLLGWMYAILFLAFVATYFNDWYDEYLNKLINKDWRPYYDIKLFHPVLILIFGFVIILVVPIIAYEIQRSIVVYNPNWIIQINNKCGVNYQSNPYAYLLPLDFTKCSGIMLAFGVLFALAFIKGEYKETKVRKIQWIRTICRILAFAILLAIPYIGLMWVPKNISPYLTYFVAIGLQNFLIGFFFVGISPFFLSWLKIDQPGDLLRQVNHS